MGASPLLVLALCTARDLRTTAGHRACALAPRHLHINAHEIRRKWVITVSNSSEKCAESYRISGVPRPSHCRAPSIFPMSPSKKILIETIFFPFWPPHKPPPGLRCLGSIILRVCRSRVLPISMICGKTSHRWHQTLIPRCRQLQNCRRRE